jgi:NADH-ubiquinone oxidoreductase chain 1
MLFFFDFVLVLVGALLGVAFFTLVERKVLGYVHFRKGPTKVFIFGLLQPITDAVKLFRKENIKGYGFSFYLFLGGPVFGLFLMMLLWGIYSGFFYVIGRVFGVIFVFRILSLGVYFLLFCSWGSRRKYALLGGYRGLSQTVSYEVSLIFFALCVVYVGGGYDLCIYFSFQFGGWFLFYLFVLFFCWLFVCMAESNRTPFDFSEGESELVSGFNVEYSGGVFSLIFIFEYGMIIFLGFLRICLFGGRRNFFLKLVLVCILFVVVRSCFPRYRYDLLMMSA